MTTLVNRPLTAEEEFSYRRSLPGAQVIYANCGRTFEVRVVLAGFHLGTKVEMEERGRIVSTVYMLPEVCRFCYRDVPFKRGICRWESCELQERLHK